MLSKTKISKIIADNPNSTPQPRKMSVGIFDLIILVLISFFGIHIWNEDHSSQKQLQSMGFATKSEGKVTHPLCKLLNQSSCIKESLVIEGDTLVFYSTQFDSYLKAFTYIQEHLTQSHTIQIGKQVWLLDTLYNELWNPELIQIWQYIKDPHSTIAQQNQRPFPLNGLIPTSEHIVTQSHLGYKSPENWLCKSYSLKSGSYDYCLAQFSDQNKCKQWLQQFGKPKTLEKDSVSGVWQSSDGEENVFLACQNAHALSISGTIPLPYLNQLGLKGKELIRLFNDWNDG